MRRRLTATALLVLGLGLGGRTLAGKRLEVFVEAVVERAGRRRPTGTAPTAIG